MLKFIRTFLAVFTIPVAAGSVLVWVAMPDYQGPLEIARPLVIWAVISAGVALVRVKGWDDPLR